MYSILVDMCLAWLLAMLLVPSQEQNHKILTDQLAMHWTGATFSDNSYCNILRAPDIMGGSSVYRTVMNTVHLALR